ncbi:type IV secretory system conjugative DNA transfer family protein [Aliirhizobium smilacinae]|uniref:Type IV secretory system conjugative DNA transfer family protein n=1 Tax=Aliirhizobium smilacinae TaxID=1395944 RepID=A0A5C4XPE8_9HYPH|nr:type IV secretory system conjugative DNA transfer family protein [Rhizobium smilacinae]
MTDRVRIAAIAMMTLAGIATWQIAYAGLLLLFHRDGRILELMVEERPFAPIEQFWTYGSSPALLKIALLSLVPAFFVGGLICTAILKKPDQPLGSAAFQDRASLRRNGWFRKDGYIVGKYGGKTLKVNDDRHHLIIGPTRSGKGVGYVIPNAREHKGSMIVTDLKGEIYLLTAEERRKNGHQVFRFAPGQEETNCYNPLDFIRQDRGDRTTDIQNIAGMLIPEVISSENAVWQATAQQVLAGVISYILESPHYSEQRNLGGVNAFLSGGEDLQTKLKGIKENEPYLSKFTVESFNAYTMLADRAAQSALLDIQKAMRPFKNERIVAATRITDINIAAMRERPVSIYLAPNINDIALLRPLLALFVQQTLGFLTRNLTREKIPVYFLLDEFCQMKRMDEVVSKLPFVAGYNVKFAFIVQDLKSLDAVYGETPRHSLLANCGYQLIFGVNDLVTADYVARALGKRTVRLQTFSKTIGVQHRTGSSITEQVRERDLMMPQEVREMPRESLTILSEGQNPVKALKLRNLLRQ